MSTHTGRQDPPRPTDRARLLPAVVLAVAAPFSAAQSIESDVPEEYAALALPHSDFALPDVGDETLQSINVVPAHDRWSAKFGIVALADYTTFDQDAASLRQVGEQGDEFEVRSLRFMARGHFELWRKWNYVVSYEYKGFDQQAEDDWSATDLSLSTEFEGLGKLSFGKIKEPHVYEMVGDAANLPHHERLLSPFFVSRNTGVQLSSTMLDQRGTWAIGWYNDWWTKNDSFSGSGNDVAARATLLPVMSASGDRYVHVATSVRYYGGDNNTLRFRGRPATNVSDYYVDSGNIPADHAWNVGFEVLANLRGYSLLGEYVSSNVSSGAAGSPSFAGYYLTLGWVLSGESRPYDRKAGYARRVQPQGRWGAFEIIARYGVVDINDASVRGGRMDGWWAGLNWWATRRWKASVGYGNVDLDKTGITGNTETLLSRLQWIF